MYKQRTGHIRGFTRIPVYILIMLVGAVIGFILAANVIYRVIQSEQYTPTLTPSNKQF